MRRSLMLFSALLWSAAPAQTLLTGLVGYWNFDDGSGTVLVDRSGNANHGTLLNSPAWTSSGRFGSALTFDGTDQSVQVASPVGLPTGNGARTVAAWVNLAGEVATSGTNRFQSLVSWGTPLADAQLFSLERAAAGSYARLYVTGWNNDAAGATTDALPLGEWVHVAVTFDGSTLRFYRNGLADGLTAASYSTTLGAAGLLIGNIAANDGWHVGLNGRLDELYVYNRALSASEIGTLMSAPVPEPASAAVGVALGAFAVVAWCRRHTRALRS